MVGGGGGDGCARMDEHDIEQIVKSSYFVKVKFSFRYFEIPISIKNLNIEECEMFLDPNEKFRKVIFVRIVRKIIFFSNHMSYILFKFVNSKNFSQARKPISVITHMEIARPF